MARHAIGSKDAFYTRYGSLYETGDLQSKKDLAKINPTAAKLTQKEMAAQRRKELLDSRESKAVEDKTKAAPEPPRAEKVSPTAEAEKPGDVKGAATGGLQERAKKDPEAFKSDLKEAFPDAKPEELDKLYQQALKGEELGQVGGQSAGVDGLGQAEKPQAEVSGEELTTANSVEAGEAGWGWAWLEVK